jgi:hypothetical protein
MMILKVEIISYKHFFNLVMLIFVSHRQQASKQQQQQQSINLPSMTLKTI